MTDTTAPPLIDQYAYLFYEEAPRLDVGALTAAWSTEGVECEAHEPRREKGEEVLAFRGGTLVIVSGLTGLIDERFASAARQLATFDYDWAATHVVDPHAALRDLTRARFVVQVRTRVARPAALVMAANDLVCSVLGIDRVQPCVAAWFESSQHLVGRADLTEYLSYQDTRDGRRARTPESLFFSLTFSNEAPQTLGTRGLSFFEHPEIYAPTGSFDAVRALYDAAAYVVNGTPLSVGHTLEQSAGSFEAVAGEWQGKPALQLRAR